MAKRIQDVVPPTTMTTEQMIAALYIRGVTIQQIFGKYYEYDEHEAARDDELFGNDEEGQHGKPRLVVGDVHLAGWGQAIADAPTRQPF